MNKRKTLIRFGSLLAIVIGLISVYLFTEHVRGELALKSRLDQLRKEGAILDVKDLAPSKVLPEQNAALDLLSLTNALKPFSAISSNAPIPMKLESPGRALVSWRQENWTLDNKTTNSWEQFSPKIAAAEPLLDKLETIWSKPDFDDGFDYAKGFVDFQSPPIVSFKQTGVLLSQALRNDLHRGDLEAARKHLHSLLAVTHALGQQPLLISQLVDEVLGTIAFQNTWELLQREGWRDAELADLQTAWASVNDFPKQMEKSVKLERAMTLDYFRQIRSSPPKARAQLSQIENLYSMVSEFGWDGPPTQGFWLTNVHLRVWQIAWAAQDELHALDKWPAVILAAKAATVGSWKETLAILPGFKTENGSILPLAANEPTNGLYNRCRYLFSLEPFSVDPHAILRALKSETEKNMAITAIALKRFQLRHGRPAAQLKELVPEFLPAAPLDRMDGKPLRYILNNDGSFKLYSVGTNLRDDNGNPTPENSTDAVHKIWDGRDAVWPSAAFPKSP